MIRSVMGKERLRESVCDLKSKPRPVHGEMGAQARMWWLLDGDRGTKAVSGRWVVVQGVEQSHWLALCDRDKKERGASFSTGSRGGHGLFRQHSRRACPGFGEMIVELRESTVAQWPSP